MSQHNNVITSTNDHTSNENKASTITYSTQCIEDQQITLNTIKDEDCKSELKRSSSSRNGDAHFDSSPPSVKRIITCPTAPERKASHCIYWSERQVSLSISDY